MINFLHIPKTGGNSLKALIEGENIRFWGHREKVEIPHPSFCFVRNPYDRLVSAYFYLTDDHATNEPDISYKQLLLKYDGFKDFVMNIERDRLDKAVIHLKPMSHFICDNGMITIDRVFKIEEPDTINQYLKEINVPKKIESLFLNTSKHERYTEYLDGEIISEVNRIYRQDFEYFGYEMI